MKRLQKPLVDLMNGGAQNAKLLSQASKARAVSVALFSEEVQAIVDNMTAYQMVEKYGRSEGLFPKELMDIVDKKFVFKVLIDEYNLKKLMPVFNVMWMSNDPNIIESVCATATPEKPENEATSLKVVNVMPLDFESQTDECVNPQNEMKNATAKGEATSAVTGSREKRKADAVEKPVMTVHEENSATKKTGLDLLKEIKLEKP